MDRAVSALNARLGSVLNRAATPLPSTRVRGYVVALAAVAVCIGIRAALSPLLSPNHLAFLVFALAVIAAAWAGGFGAGLFATAVSAVVSSWAFETPIHSFAVGAEGAVAIVVFVVEGVAISFVAGRLRTVLSAWRESEERLRLAQEAAHLGTWELDIRTGATYWSESSERIHGLPPGTFGGNLRASLAMVHPDDLARLQAVRARDAIGIDNYVEYRIRRPGGEERWIAAHGRRVSADRAVGVHVDITDRKRVETSLRESEERFREMANAAPVLVWMANGIGDATFFNAQWLRFTGRSLRSEAGGGWLGSIHPADAPAFRQAYAAAVAAHRDFEAEFRLRDASGAYRWMLGRAAPLTGRDGRFEGLVGSCTDISARRRGNEGIRLLADLSAGLASSLDPQAVAETLTAILVTAFADWSTIHLVAEPGGVRRACARHRDPEGQRQLDRLGAYSARDSTTEIVGRVMETGEPHFVPQVTNDMVRSWARDAEHLDILQALAYGSRMALPLVARGRTIGALTLSRGLGSDPYDEADLQLAFEIARRAALAFDNASLYVESRQREVSARKANDALQFLADAGIEFSSSIDGRGALATVASLATRDFADGCAINIRDAAGQLERIAASGLDATLDAGLQAIRQSFPDTPTGRNLLRRLSEGETVCVADLPGSCPRDAQPAGGPEIAAAALGIRSIIIVPMQARNRTLGSIALFRTREEPFDPDDVSVAEQLGRRAGLSIDNSRLFAEAQERQRELVRANEAKDEFLGLMSHELRTPITVIHGGARVLKARNAAIDDETRTGMLDDIERESDRLARMLENLLALARVELDQEPIVEPVLVQRLLARILESGKKLNGRSVQVDVDSAIPPAAADPAYLEHVIRNLVGNAEKYSPPGRPIEVHVTREDSLAAVRVLDRGFGISADEAERIFERFYRSDRTAKMAGGAGMGLAVCKRLIESMGGRIWAHPRDGGGLEVGFTLPLYDEEDEL